MGNDANSNRASSIPKVHSSSSFLTAAEQRKQQRKAADQKKENAFEFLVDLKDKDGLRPSEAGYNPRTCYIPPKAWASFTPFEKQDHFDTILFFQKGKFFELYEEDARIGHQEFDLKITQRVKMSMVGVPESSFDFWAAKFLARGYKVGRVEQSETALGAEMRLAASKTKKHEADKGKIVQRALSKILTAGTLIDEAMIHEDQAGHCLSIREEVKDGHQESPKFAVCILDASTSEFKLSAWTDDICRTTLETILRQLHIKELIFTKGMLSLATIRLLKGALSGQCLWTPLRDDEGHDENATIREVGRLYGGSDLNLSHSDSIPIAIRTLQDDHLAMQALGNMMWYLRTLNIDGKLLSMKNFQIYDPLSLSKGLMLDGQALAHIEIITNSEGTEEGSLLRLLCKCVTPFGKRLFRMWLCTPLAVADSIIRRQDAVEDIMNHPSFAETFTKLVKSIPDIERIVSRIHAGACKVKEFLKLLDTLERLDIGFKDIISGIGDFESQELQSVFGAIPDLSSDLNGIRQLFEAPQNAATASELVPLEGSDERYDEIQREHQELEDALDKELQKLQAKIGSKVTYWHSAQGTKEIYLVQVAPGNKNIPKNWTKASATKTANRYVVPEIAALVRRLKETREHRKTAIKDFTQKVFQHFDAARPLWTRMIRSTAELDCLLSLASASRAIGQPACRPKIVDGPVAFLNFKNLRHPALVLRNEFIPNDITLGAEGSGRIILLTGPNMGGKSTVMRMTAVGVIMAQLGMHVPASEAQLSPVDRILTRMGAYDNIFSSASTFKVELDECSKILREATPKSLVIMDELGRGTSTFDGMAVAMSVLHELATHTQALSCFATHYSTLTDDFANHPSIRNMHMATVVDETKRELVFLYKLIQGTAPSSFGTHVAHLAGVPLSVVKRAETISHDFAKHLAEKLAHKKTSIPLITQANFSFLVRSSCNTTSRNGSGIRELQSLKTICKAISSCKLN
ncbi:hypothetical protein SISSUDRAFT_852370 [Sistotremastrum suecicum HHB10207 ss-3]|uniref:DNA mismatch repair proteins mutS family domain-containing protein n=1 Tax=Sistotremastrum suecicum HHB10207 ss-3 TaxID=1314776 RepID=A0A166CGT4_9AGAM|nr:hypothetical protein SISSUDRAFT_852370 [Sistotremastrum suecicum HHB10207 ss-3]